MGVDIHMHLVKFNHESRYFEELKLYRFNTKSGKYEELDLYPGRNSEMFGAMVNEETISYGIFPEKNLHTGSLEPELAEYIEGLMNPPKGEFLGYYDFREVNLLEWKVYIENHPKVFDYDVSWEDSEDCASYKSNPLKELYDTCVNFITFADDDFSWGMSSLADYKLIYYFDH